MNRWNHPVKAPLGRWMPSLRLSPERSTFRVLPFVWLRLCQQPMPKLLLGRQYTSVYDALTSRKHHLVFLVLRPSRSRLRSPDSDNRNNAAIKRWHAFRAAQFFLYASTTMPTLPATVCSMFLLLCPLRRLTVSSASSSTAAAT